MEKGEYINLNYAYELNMVNLHIYNLKVGKNRLINLKVEIDNGDEKSFHSQFFS